MLATAKIHILKQFTTNTIAYCQKIRLCLLLQRYTFWSNSQLTAHNYPLLVNCACYCKDTHFEAIHNTAAALWSAPDIVLATAKIHILKQFTTEKPLGNAVDELCLLLQRYTFWSNSQRLCSAWSGTPHCACYCKDTHFEAIHNPIVEVAHNLGLCLLLQRYTFWSNSQLKNSSNSASINCACYCKDTHFEAIHNNISRNTSLQLIVLATAKIHILKQFTTVSITGTIGSILCLLLQRYTFWSNSQRNFESSQSEFYCACYCKDTHFEAIHNGSVSRSNAGVIVLATAKIHILKQFTTVTTGVRIENALCLLLQRYTFWSNSQLVLTILIKLINCACYCKDTHFEAIHNDSSVLYHTDGIVLATAKIHILKQFTTLMMTFCLLFRLCLLLQRYTFWSNSQLLLLMFLVFLDCACYCKDTHFEAIHNTSPRI